MTQEQQLDKALEFLSKWNAGSYLYYLDDGKNIGENFPDQKITDSRDKLVWHLKNIKIEEKLIMPIIYHLIGDEYVAAVWLPVENKETGNLPSQIKITFKGIAFIANGGYEKQKEKETISKNLQLAQTWAIAIGTALAGLWSLYLFIKEFLCCHCIR